MFLCIATLMVGCGDDGTFIGTGDNVTVTGIVLDIDSGLAAANVKVYLLDNETIASTTATTEDGTFSIEVPAGTTNVFVTDDFVEQGDWIPTINFEGTRTAVINATVTDLVLHSCNEINGPGVQAVAEATTTDASRWGTVASMNNYFGNATAQAGLFNAAITTVNNSGGMLAVIFPEADTAAVANQTEENPFAAFQLTGDITVASDTTNCPMHIIGLDTFYEAASGYLPDTELGPNVFVAGTETVAGAGMAATFCAPGSTSTINVTLTDTDTDRAYFDGFEAAVPVRDGHITMWIEGIVDGVPGKDFIEVFAGAGLI